MFDRLQVRRPTHLQIKNPTAVTKFQYEDRTNPMDLHVEVMLENHGFETGPVTAQMFGNAGREHMDKYGKTVMEEK